MCRLGRKMVVPTNASPNEISDLARLAYSKRRRPKPPPVVVVGDYLTPNIATYGEVPAGSLEVRKFSRHVPPPSGFVLRLKM